MKLEIERRIWPRSRGVDSEFAPVVRKHEMSWRISFSDRPKRMAAQAVRWHLEDRVLVEGIRTVVFE